MAPNGPRRILIIDDNVNLAENIAEILQLDGYAAEVAASGEEALSKAASGQLDVVVTDYRLPDTNGAALLRRLREIGVQARAIVMSAYTDDQTIADAASAGAAFVAKPVDLNLLGHAIARPQLVA